MRTRFAPSLTGYLHLGHVLHMLYVWGEADVVCRIEDHDRGRARPEYEAAILETMEWLGFVPDEGIALATASGPSDYRQSDCGRHYESVLQSLQERGLVYGCECSRKQIKEQVGGTPSPASMGSGDAAPPELCYPGTCRDEGLPLEGNTVRFRVPPDEVVFRDLKLGEQRQEPKRQCGDFSLRDRHGNWTYQFACVCDDIRQGVDLVIRGEDILPSTARQIRLFEALGCLAPEYFHHPLLCDAAGSKLSKRQRSESISRLREQGCSQEEIIGRVLFLAGLVSGEHSVDVHEAIGKYLV